MLPQLIVKNSLKSRTSRSTKIPQDQRSTASYARGLALCRPLTRSASAPLARPALLKLARLAGTGKTNLLCGVRKPAASRSAIAARTPRSTASNPRDVAGSGTTRRRSACRKEEGKPTSFAASARRPPPGFAEQRGILHLTARVAGGRSCGGLPRSPASAFFLFFRAKRIYK
jgi:hypothetical protein